MVLITNIAHLRDIEKTGNEKYYDQKYQTWQLGMNQFGALYKKRYWRDYINETGSALSCAEFGASSGHILNSMPCRRRVGIELNDAARAYAQEELHLEMVMRTSQLFSRNTNNLFDFVLTTSVLEHVYVPCDVSTEK